jgi:hypothetical protein
MRAVSELFTDGAASSLLAAWDCREDRWREKDVARREWLYAHDLPAGRLYRAGFWLLDALFARVSCYALSNEGVPAVARPGPAYQGVHDHAACHLACEDPRDSVLADLPPRELW